MKTRIRKTLAATKFAHAPLIPLSARPGGGEGASSETRTRNLPGPARPRPAD